MSHPHIRSLAAGATVLTALLGGCAAPATPSAPAAVPTAPATPLSSASSGSTAPAPTPSATPTPPSPAVSAPPAAPSAPSQPGSTGGPAATNVPVNPKIPKADETAVALLVGRTFPDVRDAVASDPASDLGRLNEIYTPELTAMFKQVYQRSRAAGLKQVGRTRVELRVMDFWDGGGYRVLACIDQTGTSRVHVKTGATEPPPEALPQRAVSEFHVVRADGGFRIAEYGTDGRPC